MCSPLREICGVRLRHQEKRLSRPQTRAPYRENSHPCLTRISYSPADSFALCAQLFLAHDFFYMMQTKKNNLKFWWNYGGGGGWNKVIWIARGLLHSNFSASKLGKKENLREICQTTSVAPTDKRSRGQVVKSKFLQHIQTSAIWNGFSATIWGAAEILFWTSEPFSRLSDAEQVFKLQSTILWVEFICPERQQKSGGFRLGVSSPSQWFKALSPPLNSNLFLFTRFLWIVGIVSCLMHIFHCGHVLGVQGFEIHGLHAVLVLLLKWSDV